MARSELFSNCTVSKTQICRLLSTAATQQGCTESDWLLRNVCQHIPDDVYVNPWRRRCFVSSMLEASVDVCARSAFYFVAASPIRINHLDVAQNAANKGYPPAMALYARLGDGDAAAEWNKKAAALGDPDGLFQVAKENLALLTVAANHGSIEAMYAIGTDVMRARASFYCGYTWCVTEDANPKERDYQTRFNVGRELVDFEHVWGVPYDTDAVDALYVYVDTAARRAALQTIHALRPLLGRDVAVLIAKLVYETRNYDAECWWENNN